MTTPDHQIRLRGPWQLTVEATGKLGEKHVATVHANRPAQTLAELLPARYVGRVQLERVFHRPSGLSDSSRVRLCIDGNLSGQLIVNHQSLGELAPGANWFDVSPILAEHNRIQLDVLIDARDPMRQPEWDARLEIFDGATEA